MSFKLPTTSCKHSHGSHPTRSFSNVPGLNLRKPTLHVSRRTLICASAAAVVILPSLSLANTSEPQVDGSWDSLIPSDTPYPEIIGRGQVDVENDRWLPQFDTNATKLNPALNGAYVNIPGFLIPIEMTTGGVTSFILAPYAGACLHTPPPPPNQLIFVTTDTPWPSFEPFEAVSVAGRMQHAVHETDVAVTGYELEAEKIDVYLW